MHQVTASRRRSAPMFQCDNCDQVPIDASMRAARRHTAETGHTVLGVIEESITYTPEAK